MMQPPCLRSRQASVLHRTFALPSSTPKLRTMLHFENPQYFQLLWLLLPLAAIYIYACLKARRNMARLGDPERLKALMPGRSPIRQHVKFVLLTLALVLLVATLARPQYGLKQQTEQTQGIEAVVMVDVSNSMMATDVLPNRLERAKLLVSNLVDRMKNDKIALGVFAGEAYPQLPITSDYASAKMFIEALSTGMVTLQGTNLAAAIELAQKSFSGDKKVGKAILLITDGEDHVEGAAEAAQAAAKAGINVFVLGVGTAEGSQIPTPYGALTDATGQPVHTALNEQMCREVAKAGKGIYLHLDQTNSAQDEMLAQLSRLKRTSTSTSYTARDEQFQAVALLALLLLVAEVCLSETRNSLFKRFKFFSK